ncbi:protein ZINC INDUCED FACILITATOR-LIKE 1-like [Curcuma longa]|uniref:protein ZINC INDUCED FACILITATOR-LIKE 1-like n=1 Tax=Curcuma longa TaxID=136217 RepID=UPI003D9F53FB
MGLSTSYWMAISTRLLLGLLNGISGPIKAYSVEVCREEHQSLGVSLVSTAWGIGLIIGPARSGRFFWLSLQKNIPKYFLKILSLQGFLTVCLALGVFIASLWLPFKAAEYIRGEIDEVRSEVAECIQNHIYE